jgi:hypothetical protein
MTQMGDHISGKRECLEASALAIGILEYENARIYSVLNTRRHFTLF